MHVILNITLWAGCSFGALALAVVYVNRRSEEGSANGEQSNAIARDQSATHSTAPYARSRRSVFALAVCAALTVACAVRVTTMANSLLAICILGACYCALLGAAAIDWKLYVIPNLIPLALIAVRIVLFAFEFACTSEAASYLISSLLGCFLCFLVLTIAGKVAKSGIGGGDIKLVSALGFACGLYAVLHTLLFSLFITMIVAMSLLAMKKKGTKDHLPFAPFLFGGYAISLLLALY